MVLKSGKNNEARENFNQLISAAREPNSAVLDDFQPNLALNFRTYIGATTSLNSMSRAYSLPTVN